MVGALHDGAAQGSPEAAGAILGLLKAIGLTGASAPAGRRSGLGHPAGRALGHRM